MKLPFSVNLSLDTLSERDRRTLLIGVVLGALLLVYVLVHLDSSVTSAQKRIKKKQDDLAWIQTAAPEIAMAPIASSGGESLLVIVDRSARESGLGNSLAGSEPSGADGLSVRLQKAPFDNLIMWLSRLSQQNGIRVDSASIDSAGDPGLVNAAIVLHMG